MSNSDKSRSDQSKSNKTKSEANDSNNQESHSSLSFNDLNLQPKITKVLSELGYEKPSPIQEASIPVIQSGADLIGMAQTGTGKTAAFALPALEKLI